MEDIIRIQMMENFVIYINEEKIDMLVSKSKKGAHFMQYLILHHEEPVPNYRILSTLWSEDNSSNPENALKTLVSRLRSLLNQISPNLGKCIVADRGAYHWECLPNMTIDLYELEDLFRSLDDRTLSASERKRIYNRMMDLYPGDLLVNGDPNEWALARATTLHNQYMNAVYAYIDMLKADNNYSEIAIVARSALDVDNFDDRLHMELMTALINTDRASDALVQYKHVMHLNYRYLGIQPSDNMQDFYKQIIHAGKTLDFSIESIRTELRESGEQRGAFVCEYAVFKEIYNLQMRNLERLGSTMFLGLIMVGDSESAASDSISQSNIMNSLLDILQRNLRKGDTITMFSPTMFALLLPTVNYTTGNMVMERIKRLFFHKYPNSSIPFSYRIGPLSSEPLI